MAEKNAAKEQAKERKAELLEIARICRKVPLNPAESFYEAVHSIWFVHLALHSTASHLSLGRLDQILQPYLEKSLNDGSVTEARAQEIFECFLVKAAERLTLTTEFLEKQDHTDFATGMGANPFLVDQEVTVNQFMQNIVIGGQTPEGNDAVNKCTGLILEACASVGLATPVLNVRLHKGSSDKFIKQAVATAVLKGGQRTTDSL